MQGLEGALMSMEQGEAHRGVKKHAGARRGFRVQGAARRGLTEHAGACRGLQGLGGALKTERGFENAKVTR